MTEIVVGNQTIRFERLAAADRIRAITQGFAAEWGCISCRNFDGQRERV